MSNKLKILPKEDSVKNTIETSGLTDVALERRNDMFLLMLVLKEVY